MKHTLLSLCMVFLITLTGCKHRPISNSGYDSNPLFRGELNELAILGIDANDSISESDIQLAIQKQGQIKLSRRDKIVLIQSGARFPDDAFLEEIEALYQVIPLSGIPNNRTESPFGNRSNEVDTDPPLDKALRLTAARAGASTVIVYWGILESSRKGFATKSVSWVPIVGSFIPDEDQEMRIRLKAAVIDVATGYWEMLIPEVYEDKQFSTGLSRHQRDQQQVEFLKEKGYRRLIADL